MTQYLISNWFSIILTLLLINAGIILWHNHKTGKKEETKRDILMLTLRFIVINVLSIFIAPFIDFVGSKLFHLLNAGFYSLIVAQAGCLTSTAKDYINLRKSA